MVEDAIKSIADAGTKVIVAGGTVSQANEGSLERVVLSLAAVVVVGGGGDKCCR